MKKIYYLFVLLTMCTAFISCSDDNDDATKQTLQVISSAPEFEVNGGTGTIEIASTLPVTAMSSAEWCVVTVNGNIVNLTVSANPRMESRSAMVTLTNGADETMIPIYQNGLVLFDTTLEDNSEMVFGIEGGDISYQLKSDTDIQFSGFDESWITYTWENDLFTLHIKSLPNEMRYRTCNIQLAVEMHQLSFTVIQKNTNITGTWNCYINNGETPYGTCLVEATETANRYKVTPTGSAFDAPYYITVSGTNVIISFGQVLGPNPSNPSTNIVLCAFDNTNSRFTWSSNVQYIAPINFTEDGSKTILQFGDNNTWQDYTVEGFYYAIENNGSYDGSGIYSLINMVWISQ